MPPNAADQENYAPENSNPENSKPEEVNPMTTKDTLKPQINPTLNMILKRIENATLDTRTNPGHKYSPSAPLFRSITTTVRKKRDLEPFLAITPHP